jgi:hypothetical protein
MLKHRQMKKALLGAGMKCAIARLHPAVSVSQTRTSNNKALTITTAVAVGFVSVPIHYEISSCLRTIDGRQSTFLYLETWGHAANQSQWRNVA